MTNECRARVRPLPSEAPELMPPTLPVRQRDLVMYRALAGGYEAAQAKDPKGTLSFDAFSAGVKVALEYLRAWDRRK